MSSRPVSQTAAARLIFVDAKRFRELESRGVIPKRSEGGYDLDAVREAYCRYMVEAVAGRATSGSADLTAERARLASEQADATAIKNSVARGELVRLDVVCRAVSTEYGVVRERILAIPGRLSGMVPQVAMDLVASEIDEALDELHDPELHPEGTEASESGPDAAPEDEPRGVGRRIPARQPKELGKSGAVEDKRPTRRVRANARRDGK